MKERPIAFNARMVRAILEGKKTQTRRVVNVLPSQAVNIASWERWVVDDEPQFRESGLPLWVASGTDGDAYEYGCKYGDPGDRLWVRETWCGQVDYATGGLKWDDDGNTYAVYYRATDPDVVACDDDGGTKFNRDGSEASPWKPSIHMPRWASRILLEITGVRVERLQDISGRDCIAEGIDAEQVLGYGPNKGYPLVDPGINTENRLLKNACTELWDSINGKTHPWASNPWVWVIEFKIVENGGMR